MDTHDLIRPNGVENAQEQETSTTLSASCVAIDDAAELAEFPRTVIRGESLPTPHTMPPISGAFTDWLNITFPFPRGQDAIPALLYELNRCIDYVFGGLTPLNKGLNGYRHAFVFDNAEVRFAYGGPNQNGTGYLSIPGTGCALLEGRWDSVAQLFENDFKARITRWDGAVDDYEGQHSVDLALDWYLNGRFGTGGNKSKMSQVGNWAQPDGSGRTLKIGARKNGKLLRVYEKGKQIGRVDSPWTRWEVELHNTDRCIPFKVLLNPQPYVAGSYKCMDWISEDSCRIRTTQKTAEISYDHLTDCLRTAYGRHINVMKQVLGSDEAVVEALVRGGVPKRLKLPNFDLKSLSKDK